MNIFMVDSDPVESARMLCDKHVGKMAVESAQMLSTAHRVLDGNFIKLPSKSNKSLIKSYIHPNKNLDAVLYKSVHINHPSTIWTRESKDNYLWHYLHFCALCDEYTFRYKKIHATDLKLRNILKNPPSNIPNIGQTPIRCAINEKNCLIPDDPIQSYRNFYKTKEKRFKMIWSGRAIPDWFIGIKE